MSDQIIDSSDSSTEPPTRRLGSVKAIGTLGILAGIVLIVAGIAVWIVVSSQLRAENITVPDDAMAFQGAQVAGPLTAYVQADIIQHHALEMSDGKTYAELDMDDPLRATLMNASFLRASLFTSVVSFGVAAFAMGMGVLSILFGWALRRLATAPAALGRAATT
ncbi:MULTISPECIES: aromatic ring-opening dioxygenase LigA [unclassified Microbacterium]|uniref:aromatic ring-opening dioxygenase LigA n=1 Tax=unclassified Microbacterium TaxID=2609290 RepID=UPI0012FB6C1D|nr:aromatic ring-opening dioxygenase LigA [Microbacterium sp. MAH-37]MVQ44030.1 aromatic ring-opening dioxygenase LigA [Microbacterium sp. MAH-37]